MQSVEILNCSHGTLLPGMGIYTSSILLRRMVRMPRNQWTALILGKFTQMTLGTFFTTRAVVWLDPGHDFSNKVWEGIAGR